MEEDFFGCPLPVWASLEGGWSEDSVTSPSTAPSVSLTYWALFLFLSTASMDEMRVVAGVGGWGTTTTPRMLPLA